jgi:hypothetical protein
MKLHFTVLGTIHERTAMKDGAMEILGKTIRGVLITTGPGRPTSQVFLVFEDGT